MQGKYKILDPADLDGIQHADQAFSLDVLIGLSDHPKRLKSKYFYDDEGSRLFQEIMGLPEYYLTDREFEILQTRGPEVIRYLGGKPFNLVEFGAGDGLKTSELIRHFQQGKLSFEYMPIDISEGAMKTLISSLDKQFPQLSISGVVAEYFDALKWISQLSQHRNLVLFLGSNLGNFSRAETKIFLRSLWNCLNDDDLVMIGFDLKKNIDQMLKAYNDSRGITAAFNMNLLQRINRELNADFDLDKYRFYATYNVFSGAIESYLVSLEPQVVFIGVIGQRFTFKAWEPIHTEYSYKYLESDVRELAAETGYHIEEQFYDSAHDFVDSLWRVVKH